MAPLDFHARPVYPLRCARPARSAAPPLDAMNINEAHSRLQAERSRLEGVLQAAGNLRTNADEAAERELGSNEQHAAEQASETLESELDSSVVQRMQSEIGELDAALQRLSDGSYGKCEVCGQPISDARLEGNASDAGTASMTRAKLARPNEKCAEGRLLHAYLDVPARLLRH